MERFIEKLIDQFDSGELSRREFCETMAVATAVLASGGAAANAAAPSGFTMLGINHISYQCPDYRMARDFYRDVFGMQVVNDKGMGRANLAFGPEQGKGGQFLITRNFGNNERPANAVVDHICYSLANWDDTRVNNALKAAGTNPTGRAGSVNIYDPNNYQVQIASITAENPWI